MKTTAKTPAPARTRTAVRNRTRPVLRLVTAERPRRIAASFTVSRYMHFTLEIIPEAVWDRMSHVERDPSAKRIPGVGYLLLYPATPAERDAVEENRLHDLHEFNGLRGVEC